MATTATKKNTGAGRIAVPAEAQRVRKPVKKTAALPITAPVGDYFKTDEQVTTLTPEQLSVAVTQMVDYATKDHIAAQVEIPYGEALYNILKLEIETQKAIVWAIADRNGVVRPDYPEAKKTRGRQPSGRKQLAEAQYGLWPEMLTLEGKNKDTRAGMLVTYHVRNYKIQAGLMEARATRASSGVPKRTLRRSFAALWAVIKNDRETRILVSLFERLGIKPNDLETWESEANAGIEQPA